MRAATHADQSPTPTRSKPAPRRWLLFVHQLPSHPSNLRVSTWRRLQQLGAIPLKQAVYVLPDTANAREDFEWLKTEVKGAGGDASVFAADNVDAWSDDALVEEFRRSRQDAYAVLARDAENALKRASGGRRPRGARAPAVHRLLDIFRERLTADRQHRFLRECRPRSRHHAARTTRGTHDECQSRHDDLDPGRVRRSRRLPGAAVGHPASTRRRSDGLGLADSTFSRSSRALCVCRRSTLGA